MALTYRQSQRGGAALVEVVLVLPILLILTFGAIEYGWMFVKDQQVTNAAREGARVAATLGSTNAQVQSAISSIMNANGMGGSGYTVTLSPANVSAVQPHQMLTVSVSVPYSSVGLSNMSLIPVPTQLGGSLTMYKEGPSSTFTEGP